MDGFVNTENLVFQKNTKTLALKIMLKSWQIFWNTVIFVNVCQI